MYMYMVHDVCVCVCTLPLMLLESSTLYWAPRAKSKSIEVFWSALTCVCAS